MIKTTKLKAFFGWVGGKSLLAYQIVSLMPLHALYVEVFGGGLSVLYAKEILKGRYIEVVNDYNSQLINLHRVVKTNPESLRICLNSMLVSREVFDKIKKGIYKPKNNIESAAYYYYLLSLSFGSKGDNFAMTKSRKAKNIYKNFGVWSKRLKNVTIENLDFAKLIKEYDREESFFYCDPPYFGTETYYKNIDTFGVDKHKQLYSSLSSIKGKFLLSYNDCEFIRELYKDFKNVHKRAKKVKELFIMNY